MRSELARSSWGGEVLLFPSFSGGCGMGLQQDFMHLAWPCEQQRIGCAALSEDELHTVARVPMRPVMGQAQAKEGNAEAKSASTASIVRTGLRHFCM